MGQQQSKDELLYQQVNYGNIEGIKALRSEGAGLEWTDGEKKTPLIAACMNPQLYNVAKTLIELGANINAYRPGGHGGTPLHHAAKRGLEQTVKLLLSHGANALVMNDVCQTPLDVARAKGYSNVVRAIEEHVCLFSGWLRELYGPGFLELLAPQLLSRKDAQPRTIVPLWKSNLEEPSFNQPDPVAIISDISKIPRRWKRRRAIKSSQEAGRTRIKLAPLQESEKQQLERFCGACKGIPQVLHPIMPFSSQVPTAPAIAPPTSEDDELAMAINASLQSASSQERPPPTYGGSVVDASTSSSGYISSSSHEETYTTRPPTSQTGSKCEVQEAGPSGSAAQQFQSDNSVSSVVQITPENPSSVSVPSAPALNAATDDSPILYPSIDMSPVEISSPALGAASTGGPQNIEDNSASSCTICLDAPLEGACIPCGHMAGCMSCLNEIKAKKWGCPVCRTKIDQVIRIYAV